jgi:hypothetical protein
MTRIPIWISFVADRITKFANKSYLDNHNAILAVQIRILQGAMAVPGEIFHARIPIGVRVVANPVDLRSLILHLWKHCSMNCSFGTADF